MALKKGVCKNFDNCSLADNNEIQEVDSTEFKCQECGKDLHELESKTKGAAGGNKKLPLIIAAAVVVLGGGGAGAYFGLSKKDKAPVEDTAIEAVEAPAPEQKEEPKTTTTTTTPKQATPANGSKNLGWANYSGPTQGGQPHGVGGTLKITTSYSIDLKDGRGSTLEVNAGETIENTKFENGRLRAGELHRADGTRKWFNI